jgi:hypothetical protein
VTLYGYAKRPRHNESVKGNYRSRQNKEMSVRLRAIYRDGAFVPITNGDNLDVPENAEVELTLHDPYVVPAKATSDEERERALRELFASWDAYPLRADAPRLTRDEMHERR